jgi:hypothetical protein
LAKWEKIKHWWIKHSLDTNVAIMAIIVYGLAIAIIVFQLLNERG